VRCSCATTWSTSRENNVRPADVAGRARRRSDEYRWKGNIRELRNTVRAAEHHDERRRHRRGRICRKACGRRPGGRRARGAAGWAPKPGAEGAEAKAGTLSEFKENAERMFLVGKLRENGWNISKTAEVIGTPRSNLYKKLEQYQITQESDG
jgi:two-component system nitrogen regulation response regulator NtrX